jgi:hypothetical protein
MPPLVSGRWGVLGGRLPLHWGPPPPVLLRNLALRSGGQWQPPCSVPLIDVHWHVGSGLSKPG